MTPEIEQKCRGCAEGIATIVDGFGKKWHYDSIEDTTFACQSSLPIPESSLIRSPSETESDMKSTATPLRWKVNVPPKSFPQFEAIIDSTIASMRKLSREKGGEYAGDTDRLANFRRNAAAWGIPMETVWGVYAGKHWDAISQYVKDLSTGKERLRSEPITGRVDDMIVYLLLFKLMYEERQESRS